MSGFFGGVARRLARLVGGPLSRLSREDRELIGRIRAANLTYLTVAKLGALARAVRRAEGLGLAGEFVETGCALGGSTILIARLKRPERPLRVFDVFGMIPPPTAEDGEDVRRRYETIRGGASAGLGGDRYYGYEENLLGKVRANLRSFGVEEERDRVALVPGLLQETMRVDGPVAFAHVDVDWYDPVRTCLERIVPHLVVGGTVILDDYGDWSGCRRATDEYFATAAGRFARSDASGSLSVTRVAP